jgi:hypothetical protein
MRIQSFIGILRLYIVFLKLINAIYSIYKILSATIFFLVKSNSLKNSYKQENKQVRKDILSTKIVQDAIKEAEHEEFSRCNTDWSGLQGGF